MNDRALRLLAVSPVGLKTKPNGFSLRVGNLLRELSGRWQITLVTLADPEEDTKLLDRMAHVVRIRRSERGSGLSDRAVADAVREVVEKQSPSVALLWAGTEQLTLDGLALPPVVVDRIDAMTLIAWRDATCASSLRRRVSALRNVVSYAWQERQVVRSAACTVVVGEDDAAVLRRVSGRHSVRVVPNGVRIGNPARASDRSPVPLVLFSGTMAYPPNIEAARFFVTEIWEMVRARVPEARFAIAGRMPTPEVLQLGEREGVEVWGDVPDMAAALREAWVAVAPMRSGGGIKNKVLEAWAVGTPVVMTPMAANGLELDAAADSLVGATPVSIAERVVRLLTAPSDRERLGAAAFRLASERHTWADAAARLERLLLEARARAASGGPRRAVAPL